MQLSAQTVGTLVAWLAALVTIGSWTTAAFLRPRTGTSRLDLAGDRLVRVGQASIVVSLLGIALQTVQTSHDGSASSSSTGWLVAGAFTLLSLVLTFFPRFESALYVIGLNALALVAPVAAHEASVPRNHDITGDAGIVAVVAFTLLAGTALGSLALGDDELTPTVRHRLRMVSAVAGGIAVVFDVIPALTRGIDAQTGWLLVRAGCAAVVAALLWATRRPTTMAAAVVGIIGTVAGVEAHLVAPAAAHAAVTPDVRAFGYSVADWPTLVNLVVNGRLNLLFLALSLAAVISYLVLVRRLHARGEHWSAARTFAWVVGWAIVVLITSGGVGRYAPAVFSVHMFMNLGLNMLCAMVLVLGGFITLVRQAFPPSPVDQPAGMHEWVDETMHSRLLGLLYNPIIALVFMTGTYYAFYLTSLYTDSLHVHWLHQYFYLHFLVSGYIFYGLIIGVDQPPHPLPHIGKLGLIIGAMPFHAFFGVILMSKETVFAQAFLESIGYPWMAARGLMHDQWVGGTIAWAGGEFPLVIALAALITQWKRQDNSEGRALDEGFDQGTDDSYDAYNDMLAQLAERDRTGR